MIVPKEYYFASLVTPQLQYHIFHLNLLDEVLPNEKKIENTRRRIVFQADSKFFDALPKLKQINIMESYEMSKIW